MTSDHDSQDLFLVFISVISVALVASIAIAGFAALAHAFAEGGGSGAGSSSVEPRTAWVRTEPDWRTGGIIRFER